MACFQESQLWDALIKGAIIRAASDKQRAAFISICSTLGRIPTHTLHLSSFLLHSALLLPTLLHILWALTYTERWDKIIKEICLSWKHTYGYARNIYTFTLMHSVSLISSLFVLSHSASSNMHVFFSISCHNFSLLLISCKVYFCLIWVHCHILKTIALKF